MEDVSLLTDYATLLGYTQQELTHYFSLEIDLLAQKESLSRPATLDKIKHWYNGYRFSKEKASIYNPFSTLLLFKQQEFSVHWFEMATPIFLVNLMQERQFDIANIDNSIIREVSFSTYEIDKLSIMPLLYQTGYLTIKSYDADTEFYTLGYPNWEVETAFLESLLTCFAKVDESVQNKFILNMIMTLI